MPSICRALPFRAPPLPVLVIPALLPMKLPPKTRLLSSCAAPPSALAVLLMKSLLATTASVATSAPPFEATLPSKRVPLIAAPPSCANTAPASPLAMLPVKTLLVRVIRVAAHTAPPSPDAVLLTTCAGDGRRTRHPYCATVNGAVVGEVGVVDLQSLGHIHHAVVPLLLSWLSANESDLAEMARWLLLMNCVPSCSLHPGFLALIAPVLLKKIVPLISALFRMVAAPLPKSVALLF